MADNQTRIIISAVDNTRAALNSVDSGLRGLSDRAVSVSKAFGSVAASVTSLVAVGGIATKIVDVQRQFDVVNASLVTMTGSAAQAKIAFGALQQFAATTPFSLQEVTTAFVKLKSLGLDPSQRALESYGNTASAMGKSLNQLIEAVADASTGEFERLKEFGIKARQSGDQVALTFQGVTTTIGKNANEITDYLTQIGEHQFAGAMAERAKTLDGAISNLADSWDNLFLTVSNGNAGSLIYDSVTLASGAIGDMTTIVKAMTSAADESSRSTGAMSVIQEGIATVFETVAVLGANVAYVFKAVGTELGGLAAQANAVAHLDFSGAARIDEAMREDAAAARKEVDALSERILNARNQAVATAASLDDLAKSAGNAGAAINDGLDKYLGDLTNAPKSVKIAASVEKENAAFREAIKGLEETDARYIQALEAHRQRIAEINKQSSGGTQGRISDYAKLTASIEQAIAAQNVEIATGEKATESEKLRAKITEQLASGQLKLTAAQQAGVAAMVAQLAAGEQNLSRLQAEATLRAEIAKDEESRAKAVAQTTEQIKKDTASIIEHTTQIGKSKAEIEALSAQRDLDTVALKENELALLESSGQCTAYTAALREQIVALKERSSALNNQSFRQVEQDAKDAAKKIAEQGEKAADKIGDSITDALMRAFESGKDAAETLRDTVVNMFKTMVLRPIVQAVVVGGVSASGLASADSGGSGGIGNWLSAGNSAYNAYTNGIGGLYTNFATSGIGSALGLSAGLSSTLGVAGGAGSIMGGSAALAAAEATAFSGASALTSVGSAIGAALPYVGLAMAAASLLSGKFKGGTPHAGGIVFSTPTGTVTPNNVAGIDAAYTGANGDYIADQFKETDWTKRFSQDVADSLTPTAEAISNILNSAAKTFDQESGYTVGLAFSSDGEDKSRGRFGIKDAAGEEVAQIMKRYSVDASTGIQQLIGDVGGATRDALYAMDLPGWADSLLESLGGSPSIDDLISTVQQINAIAEAAERLAPAFKVSVDDFSEIYLSAGADTLATYYSTVFSDVEKQAHNLEQVTDAFDELGFSLPTSIAGFRELVESQDATTEAGRKTIASLMGLTSAFSTVQSAADAAAAAAAAIVNSRQETQANRIDAYLQAQQSANIAAVEQQQEAYANTIAAAQEMADSFENIIDSLDDFKRSLLQSDQSTLSPEQQYAEAKRQFELTAAKARLGDTAAADNLQEVINDFLSASKKISATSADYAIDFGKSIVALDGVIGTASNQANIAIQQLSVAQAQLAALNNISASLGSTVSGSSAATDSLPIVVKDFTQAMLDWEGWFANTTIGQTQSFDIGSTTRISNDKGIFTDLIGNSYVFSRSDGPYALADQSATWAEEMLKRYGKWSLPSFDVGTDYVPQDMIAMIHQGEKIVPRAFNWSGFSASNDVVAELQAIRKTLDAFRLENSAENRSVAASSGKVARILERLTPEGDALATREREAA